MPSKPLAIGFNVPFKEAIESMDARGVVLPAKYYGELQGLHRTLNFSIAVVAALDQLQAVLDSLTAKLADGLSFKQWQDSVAVQDLGLPKHRLDNIYRTNIQSAYNRGHWEQFKKNEKFAPYLLYDAINDSRTRPSHRAMDGIIRPINDAFWHSHYPPNGYRCRCRCVALSHSQALARSKNGTGLNQPIDLDNMQPDKGWDYHVGQDLTAGIEKAVAERITSERVNRVLKLAFEKKMIDKAIMVETLDYENALTQVKQGLESTAFAEFYHGSFKGNYPVGVLSESDQTLLNAKTKTILLSRESLDEHKVSHPDIGLDDYRKIAEIIENGEIYRQKDKRFVLLHINDKLYRASIKTTQDAKENYFLSLFTTTEELADIQIRKKFERLR